MKIEEVKVGMKVRWSGPEDCKDVVTEDMQKFYDNTVFEVNNLSHGRYIYIFANDENNNPMFSALAYPEELTKCEEQ